MNICIFEDNSYKNLYPLTLTRPVWELKCGHTLLYEKIARRYKGARLTFKSRNEKIDFGDKGTLYINGRSLFLGKTGHIPFTKKGKMGCVPVFPIINDLWDLIKYTGLAIKDDFLHLKGRTKKKNLYIAKTAKVHPSAVLDTSNGPIIIEDEAVIHPFSWIVGPAAIGKGSIIVGAKIRENTAIGPYCRIGGEVTDSIFYGYSNKAHDGFIGHTYIGEWVNLGALTTTSNMRNDYATVPISRRDKRVDSGCERLGAFIGDHTKTAIGTLLNTGTVVGVGCNLASSGQILPKEIPSFRWFIKGRLKRWAGFEEFLKVAKAMAARRDKRLTPKEIATLRNVYKASH